MKIKLSAMTAKLLAIIAFVSVGLTGCADVNKQDVGTITGGVLGGALGSQFGGGKGRIVSAVAGTLVGAYIGSAIGKNMDETDRLKMSQTFETAPSNTTTTWVNPDTHARYSVTPRRTYYQGAQPCREYTTTAIIGGQRQRVYGTACRTADGSWRIVNQN